MTRYHLVALAVIVLSTLGCTTRVTEFTVDGGGLHKVGTFTQDESWKRLELGRIDSELAGGQPEAGIKTWREYWKWTYANIRRYPTPAWKSAEFKTADDMVRYIERCRAAKGLPAYD